MNRIFIQIVLWPFSVLYRLSVGIRNRLFDYKILRSTTFKIPVISVGNITVGGTGKTPFVEFLLSFLKDDFKVAALSRGYKRKSKGFFRVTPDSKVQEVGDEPLQMKQKYPVVQFAVDRNRVHGIQKLKKEDSNLNVIILDDAFQHRYVQAGLSILLIDFNRPFSSDHFLPLGTLREDPHEMKRAHIIIVTKCPDKMKPIDQRIIRKELNIFPYQKLFFTGFNYLPIKPVFSVEPPLLSDGICKKEKYRILLVTGIANTRPLRKHIRSISPRIQEIKFADHHFFSEKDLQKIYRVFESMEGPRLILTTEKDAVRLRDIGTKIQPDPAVWYFIPVKIKFFNQDKNLFKKIIVDYVTKNKRYSILSSGKN